MSYVGRTLGRHERMVLLARFPWVLRAASWTALILLAVLPLLGALISGREGWQVLALLSALVGVVIFAWTQLYMWTTELAVTDQRLVIKRGLIARHTTEIPLTSLENIELDQSVFARLCGYGHLEIAGSGQTDLRTPPHQDPVSFRAALAEARIALTGPPSYRAQARRIDPLDDEKKRPLLDASGREDHLRGVKPRRARPSPGGARDAGPPRGRGRRT